MYDDLFQEPIRFARMGIDKITLGIDRSLLKTSSSPDNLKGKIDIITYGNYSELNFQGEYINIFNPISSITHMILYFGKVLFQDDFGNEVMASAYEFLYGEFSCFLEDFFNSRIFKLDEYEIFFDFWGDDLPFDIVDLSVFYNVKGTYYSEDYKVIMRKVILLDGKVKYEKKGKVRSIVCIYDRGRHIGSPDPITRLEIRICDRKARAILEPSDLCISLLWFIKTKGHKIRGKIKKSPLPKNAIAFDPEFVDQYIPYLPWILECDNQPSITCEKKTFFQS
jgi:hypothetical protein